MRLLAIETSGTVGGIALAEAAPLAHCPAAPPADSPAAPPPADSPAAPQPGSPPPRPPLRIVDEVRLTEGLRHARDLVLTMKAACDRAAWNPRQIDCLAVSIGPGSFTGIRVAVTVAKLVAWDTGARIVAVPSLRALVENVPADCRRAAAILDAKRGGLFASIFERRPAPGATGGLSASADAPGATADFAEIFGPALIEPPDLARRIEKPALILGHGIPKSGDALAGFDIAPRDLWDIRPAAVARLGYELHLRGRHADPLRLEPVYIRPPEAQEIWERKHQ